MDSSESRRFTDEEVALVLGRASELEEDQFTGGGTGLSLRELEDIAGEVGISRALVVRAVAELDAKGRGRASVTGGPLVHRAIKAVGGELGQAATARLIQHVDTSSEVAGIVSETLGSTRWTASDRFRSTQVSITPAKGETTILVVERATARLRRIAHAVPAALGVMLTLGTVGALNPSSGMVAALAALGGAIGATAGSLIWRRLSGRSAARVERLATEFALQAGEAGGTSERGDEPTS